MTLEKAEETTGLDFRHLQQIEAGTVNVTLATALRIADGFGVAPATILVEVPSKRAPHGGWGTYPRVGIPEPVAAQAGRKPGARGASTPLLLPNPIPPELTPEAVQASLGKTIARFRKNRMTQAALAKKLGVSLKYVQKVEAGRQNLTISSIVRFANALGVEPKHLFSYE